MCDPLACYETWLNFNPLASAVDINNLLAYAGCINN